MFNLIFYCFGLLGLAGIEFCLYIFYAILVVNVGLNLTSFFGIFFVPGLVRRVVGRLPWVSLLALLPQIGLFILLVEACERVAAIAFAFIILNNINIFYESRKNKN